MRQLPQVAASATSATSTSTAPAWGEESDRDAGANKAVNPVEQQEAVPNVQLSADPADATEPETNQSANLKALALLCGSNRLPVVALHGVVNGRCTCGDQNCDQLGRHPRTSIADATTDRSMIERLWTSWPNAGVGLAMGAKGDMFAVVTEGDAGEEQLKLLIQTPPRTITIRDGKQCTRFYKASGFNLSERTGYLAKGVKILGEEELVVCPSSVNTLARDFVPGRAPGEVNLARAPTSLFVSIAKYLPSTPELSENLAQR